MDKKEYNAHLRKMRASHKRNTKPPPPTALIVAQKLRMKSEAIDIADRRAPQAKIIAA